MNGTESKDLVPVAALTQAPGAEMLQGRSCFVCGSADHWIPKEIEMRAGRGRSPWDVLISLPAEYTFRFYCGDCGAHYEVKR